MDDWAANPNYVRRLQLPSGRRIEVVYFERSGVDEELTLCGSCASNLVHPLSCESVGASHWRVELRCPNCEWCGTTVIDQDALERLDLLSEHGAEVLIEQLRQIEFDQMLEDTERFVEALVNGHIFPTDF